MTLEPPRELDALVAEALGWTCRVMVRKAKSDSLRIGFQKWPKKKWPDSICPDYGVWRLEDGTKMDRATIAFCPYYSTSVADAIAGLEAVVQKEKSEGVEVSYDIHKYRGDDGYRARLANPSMLYEGYEATLPLAAATAILAWAEAKKGGG